METIRAVFGHGWVQFVWWAIGWGVCLHAAFAAEKDFAKPNRWARIAWRFLVMAALGAFDLALFWNRDEEDGGFMVAAQAIVMIAITALVLHDKLRAEKKEAERERQRKEIERQLAEEKEWQQEEEETTDVPPAWEIDE